MLAVAGRVEGDQRAPPPAEAKVAFNFPEELCNAEMQITSTPDGRLVVGTCSTAGVMYILDRSVRVLQRVPGHWDGGIAANDDSLFACLLDDAAVCRYPHDGAAATEYRLDGYTFWAPALAPGGLLFCVMSDQTDDYTSAGLRSSPWMRRRCSFATASG